MGPSQYTPFFPLHLVTGIYLCVCSNSKP